MWPVNFFFGALPESDKQTSKKARRFPCIAMPYALVSWSSFPFFSSVFVHLNVSCRLAVSPAGGATPHLFAGWMCLPANVCSARRAARSVSGWTVSFLLRASCYLSIANRHFSTCSGGLHRNFISSGAETRRKAAEIQKKSHTPEEKDQPAWWVCWILREKPSTSFLIRYHPNSSTWGFPTSHPLSLL